MGLKKRCDSFSSNAWWIQINCHKLLFDITAHKEQNEKYFTAILTEWLVCSVSRKCPYLFLEFALTVQL